MRQVGNWEALHEDPDFSTRFQESMAITLPSEDTDSTLTITMKGKAITLTLSSTTITTLHTTIQMVGDLNPGVCNGEEAVSITVNDGCSIRAAGGSIKISFRFLEVHYSQKIYTSVH